MPTTDPPTVDTARDRSVSFAAPGPTATTDQGSTREALPVTLHRRDVQEVVVGGGGPGQVSGYPIQPAKVQRPSLRDETLARERLLDWLNVKIHHRVVFVIAEAGYGKTTLLADFTRRTRLRTLWYRLDDEDRNWIAFLNYLVAAGREHDPDFASTTAGLLREFETGGPTRQAVVDTFIREFQVLGEHGAVVILDDFHVVDETPEVREIVRDLLTRAPERVSFVISSRRIPAVRVARLRTLGEVAELTTDDLRFNETETEQLFRETYGRPLDADVLDDLNRRTEGWAASLQLVQAAIRDRSSSEIRNFVRSITGAEGELYDYLAEEVVGDLPDDLQDFLMKTSILESVVPFGVQAVTGLSPDETADWLALSERLGLVGKPQRSTARRRFHPLVREFLQQRLARDRGPRAVQELHKNLADRLRNDDWDLAAYHYAAASDQESLRILLEEKLPYIMGAAAYQSADRYLSLFNDTGGSGSLRIVASRVAQQRGDLALASTHAVGAVEATTSRELSVLTLANLLNVRMNEGDVAEARSLATRLLSMRTPGTIRAIALANLAILDASAGELEPYRTHLQSMARLGEIARHPNYLAITLLNLSDVQRLMGDWDSSRIAAGTAIDLLEPTSAQMELACAYFNRAWAYAHQGEWGRARPDIAAGLAQDVGRWRTELRTFAASITALYHSPTDALHLLDGISAEPLPEALMPPVHVTRARVLAQCGRTIEANEILSAIDTVHTTTPAFTSVLAATKAFVAAVSNARGALRLAREAVEVSSRQGALFWNRFSALVEATVDPRSDFDAVLSSVLVDDPAYASAVAELLIRRLDDVSEFTFAALEREAQLRSPRWRPALRVAVESWEPGASAAPALLLDMVGERGDVALLRGLAKRQKRSRAFADVGRGLARRCANRIEVSDLGRVFIRTGSTVISGTAMRRKVLSLLCLLLTQPDRSITRDAALDTLWPDIDPEAALNSLNQTIYFLRRVLEPGYIEDLSPGYIHHQGELVWLDPELIDSSSGRCRIMLRQLAENHTAEGVDQLLREYTGRFAQDFEYEEWAVPYREWLHSSYLETIERAVHKALAAAAFDRAIRLARGALELDPKAEPLEVLLLRAYRQSGAHAAAAEQYAHYAALHRLDFGVDPPALESL